MGPYLGLDIGSTTSKAVIVDSEGRILGQALLPTGHAPAKAAAELRVRVLEQAGARAAHAVATGYGRGLVEFAERAVTEITCHGRGVRHLHPEARTVLDLGGQDSKAIVLDPSGRVQDFAMNDRCAAGTGCFLDVIARRFDLALDDLGRLHESLAAPLEISSTCVVFAESEVVGLLSRGHDLPSVLAGVHAAIARRVATLLKQVRAAPPVYFSGGVAANETLRRAIEAELGLPLARANLAQYCGALGAALIAAGGGM